MKYICNLKDGESVKSIYLCKQRSSAVTRNGKQYDNVILQDKTGTMDCKIWEPNSPGIVDFEAMDYVEITGDVSMYNGNLQMSIKNARIADEGEYSERDYVPVSVNSVDKMYDFLLKLINDTDNEYLKKLLESFFVDDEEFIAAFKKSSAAKSIHHGFVGGLLEHTVSVACMCEFFAKRYSILNRDLLISAALLHDIGKTRELSRFPQNDYTDEGQMLGHIVIGYDMIGEKIKEIEGFPENIALNIKHCILSHHGELEFGSPKKPVIPEAFALNLADNCDAKMETLTEIYREKTPSGTDWYGYNKILGTNIRKTDMEI